MDINHHLYLLTLNGSLHLAPIPAYPNRILDIGTGTGIWAIDMGDRYPSASVIGNDLSPIQPSFVPPNVQFEVDDFCDTWTYTASTFDMIHARQMFGCVADYPKLYAEVLKALKPGGWFEQVEIDVVVQSEDGSIAGTGFEQWGPLSVEAGKKYGRSMRLLNTMRQDMIDAGFEEVKEVRFKWPIGGWPRERKMKEIGRYNGAAWDQGMEGWIMYLFTKFLDVRWPSLPFFRFGRRIHFRSRNRKERQDEKICGLRLTSLPVVEGRRSANPVCQSKESNKGQVCACLPRYVSLPFVPDFHSRKRRAATEDMVDKGNLLWAKNSGKVRARGSSDHYVRAHGRCNVRTHDRCGVRTNDRNE
jgi:SAM-dependent methyltransferase